MMSPNIPLTRDHFAADFQRPQYHFLPPSNWMNDPNGLIQWQGQYHLFYQHNPNSAIWGDMHWGHAVSPDLIHWQDWPIAIAPTPNSYDEAGIFSGCAVNNDGVPTVIYTATQGAHCEVQTQALATSADGLLTWQKYAANPIIATVPPEAKQNRDFRDPFVWKAADGWWYMVLGSRIQDEGGVIFLYRSQNLLEWEYLNPMLKGEKRHGVIWECPNFFQLGDQWVLIISSHLGNATGTVLYFIGTFEHNRFTPTSEGVLDYDTLYAPLSFVDDQGRRVLIGWLRESRGNNEMLHAGWSGVQSIPRIMSLDSAGRLNMRPVPELEKARGQQHYFGSQALEGEIELGVRGLALDIVAEFAAQPDGDCGLSVLCSADGKERLDIRYDAASQRLTVARVTASVGDMHLFNTREIPHALAVGESLKLRILLDGSVVEIIANERTSLTSRCYATSAESNHVRLVGKRCQLQALDIWEMPSIWR